jgi:hypothetical protein
MEKEGKGDGIVCQKNEFYLFRNPETGKHVIGKVTMVNKSDKDDVVHFNAFMMPEEIAEAGVNDPDVIN